jgi:pyrroloquinoline quinone biosynthesis protein D
MSAEGQTRAPRLAPGCRISAATGQGDLLLIPEGALSLKGPARAILQLCDGERSPRQIAEELTKQYPNTDAARIEEDVVALLAKLHERGVLEYV